MVAAPTPSTAQWCTLKTTAALLPAMPSTTRHSHRGLDRSSCCSAKAATSVASSAMPPGEGQRTRRTWEEMSTFGTSTQNGWCRRKVAITTRRRNGGSRSSRCSISGDDVVGRPARDVAVVDHDRSEHVHVRARGLEVEERGIDTTHLMHRPDPTCRLIAWSSSCSRCIGLAALLNALRPIAVHAPGDPGLLLRLADRRAGAAADRAHRAASSAATALLGGFSWLGLAVAGRRPGRPRVDGGPGRARRARGRRRR